MFGISWFTKAELGSDSAMNERNSRSLRQPMRSRPSLECLEERTLLDASSGMIGGSFGNPNLNSNFNLASSGVILPAPQNIPNTTAVTTNVFPSAGAGTALAVSSSFLSQGQLNSQFRDFAINSQGAGTRLDLNTPVGVLTGAFGFGSGTQPNAPWMPNAYNLGLANRQFNYSTQGDFGFSSVPPWAQQWSSPVAQSQQNNQNRPSVDNDQLQYLDKDELDTQTSEPWVAHRSRSEQDQPQQDRQDQDASDKGDDLQALIQQQAFEKKAPLDAAVAEDGTLPDSLWLSALAPVPMAGLIAGLPGMPGAESSDASAGTGDVEAPPE